MFSMLRWEECKEGAVPPGAVLAGIDVGRPYFVGRARISEEKIIPGKIFPPHHCLYTPEDGREAKYMVYEALCVPQGCEWHEFVKWTPYQQGDSLPPGAIKGGFYHGEVVYIGLGNSHGCRIPGYVKGSDRHWVLLVSYGGGAHQINNFQVLTDLNGDSIMSEISPRPDSGAAWPFGASPSDTTYQQISEGSYGGSFDNGDNDEYSEEEKTDENDRTG